MPRSRSIVLVGYRKDLDSVKNNIKYIGFRSREHDEEEKGFFNRGIDLGADYEMFINKVEHHPALQHESTVKMHTMIFSMYEGDYQALKESGANLKELAREVLADLEERKGLKLEWIGALHENSGHPHVHIGIMSVGVDADGQNRRLYLDKQNDLPWLREKFLEKIEKRVPEIERDYGRDLNRNHERVNERSKVRPASRQMSNTLQSMSQNSERIKSQSKDKRNRKRRSKRAVSRIEQQRQGPVQNSERSS